MQFDISYQPPANRDNILRLIQKHNIRTVLEIGTFLGSSAALFAAQPQIEQVTCVDPFETFGWWANELAVRGVPNPYLEVFQRNMQELGVWHKIRVLRGLSSAMVAQAPVVDLVYVDGNHTKEGCAQDIELYLPKTRKVICGDDYHRNEHGVPYYPGVIEAVTELLPEHSFQDGFWWLEL
jgi:predicted O-methyltransferase YrrM